MQLCHNRIRPAVPLPLLLTGVMMTSAILLASPSHAQELARLRASTQQEEEEYFFTTFSANGEVLLAASNRRVTLWDVDTLTEIASFKCDCYRRFQLPPAAITADGTRAVFRAGQTNDYDDILHFVEIGTKRVITRIVLPEGVDAEALALSSDTKRLAVGDDQGNIVVYNLPSGESADWSLDAYSGDDDMTTMCFLPDGRLVTGGEDDKNSMTLRIWDLPSGKMVYGGRYQRKRVNSLAVSVDGSLLACATSYENAKVYSADGDQISVRFNAPVDDSEYVSLSQDGSFLAFDDDNDSYIRIWNVKEDKQVAAFHGKVPTSFSLHPDGKLLASTSDLTGLVHVWDIPAAARVMTPHSKRQVLDDDDSEGRLSCFRFINDGKQLAFTFDYNDLRILWDLKRSQVAASLNLEKINNSSNYWESLAVDRNGRHILVGEDMVYEWLPYENSLKRFLATGEDNRGCAACFSPDNTLLAVITKNQMIALDSDKQPVLQLRGDFLDTDSASISSNNRFLALSDDSDLVLYDIKTKSELTRIDHFPGPIAFSPDGSHAFGTGKVPRLNLNTGEVDFPFNASDVSAVAVAPDLPILATADDEAAVRLWNYETGELLVTLQGHEHELTGVAIAPDGKTVASGDEEGFLCFWEITDEVLELASKKSHEPEPVASPASPDAWPNYPKTIETSHGVSIIVAPSRSVTRAEVLQALEEAASKVQDEADSGGSRQ